MRRRPFRFGVLAVTDPMARNRAEWQGFVRKVDDLGYDCLLVSDHIGYRLGPLAALAAAGQISDRLRLGFLVLSNDFRNPLILAQETATIDLLTDGRLELGIGAGWKQADYGALGMDYDRPGVRIARLEESLEVMRLAWSGEPFSFAGDHYRLNNVPGLPKPAQRPGPPVLVGGGGPKALSLAGRHGDIVNVNPRLAVSTAPGSHLDPQDVTPASFRAKVEAVRRAAGDRADDIELSTTLLGLRLDGDTSALGKMRNQNAALWDQLKQTPWAYDGSAESIADEMRAARDEHGISYYIVMDSQIDQAASLIAKLAGE